jgi:hypothetical protein
LLAQQQGQQQQQGQGRLAKQHSSSRQSCQQQPQLLGSAQAALPPGKPGAAQEQPMSR